MTTAIMEAPAPPIAEPAPRAVIALPKVSRTRWHLWILLSITLLGGLLRFSFPSRPQLWGDDAYTVYRTHADYQSMLDILQLDGFTPLHYELYWLLGRAAGTEDSPIIRTVDGDGPKVVHSIGMTPQVLRLLPALWGSIMVPAMYFLAVQLVRRRTALVVALVTACSAYLLGYSRDMKMYMMVWCFSALSAGCLLWWFRTNARIAWLAWVAASLAMASSHMTGMALLPIEAIFFLTRSNVHWKQSILFVIGLAIIILPPAAYITQFNVWAQEKVEDFGFEVEGIGWVATYNAGRTGPDLVRYATSAYLLSWEWPKLSEEPKIQPWILTTLKAATVLVLMLAGVGAMPWSKRLRGLRDDEHLPQPWWRVFLWLGLWLILPIYFMYCRSLPDFSAPKVWWNELARLLAGSAWQSKDGTISGYFWLFLSLAAAMVAALTIIFARFRRSLVWLTPLVAGALLVVCLLRSGVPRTTPQGLQWVQVIFRPLVTWADWISEPFVFTSLAIVLPGLLLLYCGPTWGQRATRIAQFVLASAALVGCCWLVYMVVQSKFDKEIAQMTRRFAAQDPADAPFIKRYNTPRAAVETSLWQSIFMPRYVGFVWIAFCIALCALLMRLPTRLLRFAAIALLVAVNLAQFSGRLFAGTEPPLDRVAKEIWKHDTLHNRGFAWLVPPDVRDLIAALIPPSERAHALHLLWGIGDASGRVYVNDTQVASSGHPGYGILNLQQGKYYLGLARGYFIAPSEWKRIDSSRDFEIHLLRTPRGRQGLSDYSTIAAEIRRSSGLKKIIVWEKYFDETTDRKDHLSSLLGTQWKLASDQDYSVRLHWNWTDLYIYRRSEYVKTETGPALRTVSTPGR